MKKDVIYIDIEDDVTAVIEKLKNSKEKIIALVPPKGNAVLQSVVNLKLIKRAADNAGKQPVIVTNNNALVALAGGLSLYVAKNLQSKPVLASAAEEVPEEEALEVSDEAVSSAEEPAGPIPLSDDSSDEVELSGEELASLEAADGPVKAGKAAKPKKGKGKNKVPNFDNFKKKLLIGGGIALLVLVLLFVLFGRTKATVVVRAETTPVDVAFDANLNANSSASDPETYNLKAQVQESKKTISQSFTATGSKDLGTKASGSMTLSIACSAVTSFPTTVPSGTTVSSGGLNFVTQSAATLSSPGGGGGCRFSGSTTVAAQNNGDQYNLSPRSYTVSGNSSITGSGSQMSGGTSKVVKVVSQSDVDKARSQLEQQDTNAIRSELEKGFGDGVTVFEDSFATKLENVRSEPAVGEEANEGRLTADATYSLMAVSDGDLGAALDAFITTKMTDKDQQRVYDNGFENMKLEKLELGDRTAKYKISTTGYYGPQFDTEALAKEIEGKKFGEARSYLQDLPGVKGVEINLSPFWARKLPNAGKIEIKLEVDNNSQDNG